MSDEGKAVAGVGRAVVDVVDGVLGELQTIERRMVRILEGLERVETQRARDCLLASDFRDRVDMAFRGMAGDLGDLHDFERARRNRERLFANNRTRWTEASIWRRLAWAFGFGEPPLVTFLENGRPAPIPWLQDSLKKAFDDLEREILGKRPRPFRSTIDETFMRIGERIRGAGGGGIDAPGL